MVRICLGLTLVAIATPLMAQSEIPEIPTSRQLAGENQELHIRDLTQLSESLFGTEEERGRQASEQGAEFLATAIRTFVSPPLKRGEDVQMLSEQYLVSIGSAEQQGWIDAFLRGQSKHAEGQTLVEATVYVLDARSFKELGLDESTRSYSTDDGLALVQRIDRAGAERRNAPRLVSMPLRKAEMRIGEPIHYVRDFQVGVDDAGEGFADEVRETLHDGTRLSLAHVHLGDDEIGMIGEVEITNADRPFPRKLLRTGLVDRELEIEIPVVTKTAERFSVAVPDGGYAVVPCPPLEGRIPVVVIHVDSM